MDHRRKTVLIQKDKRSLWHPFTQMAQWARNDPTPPLIIQRGKGVYLYDIDGKKYIDGVSSLWVTVHGHRKKEIDNAVRHQLQKVAHSTFLGLSHEPAILCAEELLNIAPRNLARVFYSDNGSTSVEIALKMAYQYWKQRGENGRTRYLSLKNAYHGDTIGSVSVGGIDLFHAKFHPLLFKNYFAPSPYCYRCKIKKKGTGYKEKGIGNIFAEHCKKMNCFGACVKEFETILKGHHRQIAAAIIEPGVQAAAGMLVMPPGYLKNVERLCRKYTVLLICDEVATGFGRTGTMFAVEHENIQPDFMCLSKGITGGYLPLAATLTSEKVYRAFLGKYEEFKTFFHGHTYTANPLACAAARANLAVFRRERVIEKLPAKIAHLKKELESLRSLRFVGDLRQFGMMAGIELVKDKNNREEFTAQENVGARVCAACRSHGLIIRPLSNVIVLFPPLSITASEITRMVKIIRTAIKTVLGS